MLKLEVGKRYRQADGDVVGPLTRIEHDVFPFWDPTKSRSWTEHGRYYTDQEFGFDIIEEVVDEVVTIEPGEQFRSTETAKCEAAKELEDAGVVFEYFTESVWVPKADNCSFSEREAVYRRRPKQPVVVTEDRSSEQPILPDSGDRTNFSTGAVRDAMQGKGLPSLIPPQAIIRLARRFEDGAEKYSRNNWMKGIPLSRFQDAIQRHMLAAAEGKTDEDHLGAVLWNAAAWIWTEDEIAAGRLPAELDDLPYRSGKAVAE